MLSEGWYRGLTEASMQRYKSYILCWGGGGVNGLVMSWFGGLPDGPTSRPYGMCLRPVSSEVAS